MDRAVAGLLEADGHACLRLPYQRGPVFPQCFGLEQHRGQRKGFGVTVLQETARLRTRYPDLPLAKLAEKFDPPVSKAGLSHRFKRIQEAAQRVREKQ